MEKPPYNVTNKMLMYISNIMEKIGSINYLTLNKKPQLRKQNRINSIHSSLAIESNQLSKNQVMDIIDGKSVIGDRKDIQEVKNAYNAYNELKNINPYNIKDLKKVHGIMMFLLEKESGKFRTHGEGVYDGDKLIFACPPANLVNEHMNNLFEWLNKSKKEVHPLILSSVFHYEFLFIHPFGDGNGRMARLWQTAILSDWQPLFEYIPIESMIKKYQSKYYKAIADCHASGNSNKFIEFILKMIDETLTYFISQEKENLDNNYEKIVNLMLENPKITQKRIAEELSITIDGVAYDIKRLKEQGRVERIGANKNGYWKVKKTKK